MPAPCLKLFIILQPLREANWPITSLLLWSMMLRFSAHIPLGLSTFVLGINLWHFVYLIVQLFQKLSGERQTGAHLDTGWDCTLSLTLKIQSVDQSGRQGLSQRVQRTIWRLPLGYESQFKGHQRASGSAGHCRSKTWRGCWTDATPRHCHPFPACPAFDT